MDLKIPKALSNRVFNNGYSKHFRDMTSGTKLKKMIYEHVWINKIFSQTYSNKAEMDLKIPKALSNRVFNNGYSKHFRDMALGDKVEENDKRTFLEKKIFLKRIRIRQETDLEFQRRLVTVFLITITASIFEIMTSGQS